MKNVGTEILQKNFGKDFFEETMLQKLSGDDGSAIGNFDRVVSKVVDIQSRSEDLFKPYSDLNVFKTESDIIKVRAREGSDTRDFGLSRGGLSSLCGSLDIPTNYIKKCIVKDKSDLAINTLNEWIEDRKDQNTFIRLTDNNAYGFLSSKYSVFDDVEVINSIYPVLKDKNYIVKNASVTPELLKMRIVSRDKIQVGEKEDDTLSYGFDISNSRTGKSSLKISFIVYRWICSNGMIMGGGKASYYSQRHVGISDGAFRSEFGTFLENIPELTKYAEEQIIASQKKSVTPKEIQQMVDQFKAMKINKKVEDELESVIYTGDVRCVWDFTNVLTAMAQKYNIETRERIETAAGRILAKQI